MKILFTCIGRRVELVQSFREAAKNKGVDLTIVGTDTDHTAPALSFCDEAVLVPRINDVRYIPTLQQICQQMDIDILIPTIDTDLMLLAKNKYSFGKTRVLISEVDKVQICRDKRNTASYFQSLGLNSPQPCDEYKLYQGGFPAFIKPIDGSSSILAYKVNNEEELSNYAHQIPNYIIQPFIQGTEYTVDIFCDFEGNPIYLTPRIRCSVRSGEVLKTKIDQDNTIKEEMFRLIKDFKPCGQITVQLIKRESDGVNHYIEINPRFGGGAPLSIKAGADSAMALLDLLEGKSLEYIDNAAENGAIFSRFDQSVRVN